MYTKETRGPRPKSKISLLLDRPCQNRPTEIFFGEICRHFFYPLANEVAKGYSNATFRPSVTSLNGF
jgi:hypothetical protein